MKPYDPRTHAVFTTQQAADVCGISLMSLIRCCDKGLIAHYRLPGAGNQKCRRIERGDLIRFAREHDLPHALEALGEPLEVPS